MHPRKAPGVVASLIVLLALVGCGHGATAPSAAATVGSTQITDAQVAKEAKLFTFLGALQQKQCGDTSSGVSEEVACNRSALTTLIQGTWVKAYADEHQITVDPKDIATLISPLDAQAGKDKIDAALTAQGLTRDDLNDLARQVQLLGQVQHALGAADLGDVKLQGLYQQQILSFTTLQVEQILVKTQAGAEHVYQQVTQPGSTEADFKALAKEVSIDPTAKDNSGEYPPAPASKYVTPFAKAAVALEPTQISRPVQSKFGWHVIRLVSKQVTPFAEAKSKVALPQSESAVFDEWLHAQAGAQTVDVNPKFGTFDLQTLSVVAVTSTDPSASASSTASTSATPSP
jgi:foldase protein PrsA